MRCKCGAISTILVENFDGTVEPKCDICYYTRPKLKDSSLLAACKKAYRKHVLGDESIGWDELGDILKDAICEEIGDEQFIQFTKRTKEA